MIGQTTGSVYVTDQSVLNDARLDFGKCVYVAIGLATETGVVPGQQR